LLLLRCTCAFMTGVRRVIGHAASTTDMRFTSG
jgi:hypothetical protein